MLEIKRNLYNREIHMQHWRENNIMKTQHFKPHLKPQAIA